MIANVLTCIGTGTFGVGVGLVINTIRNRKRKRKDTQEPNTDANSQPRQSPLPDTDSVLTKKSLRVMYGIQSYFENIEKFVAKETKEELQAFHSIQRYIDRILELNELSNKNSAKKRRYWNAAGAISANATKVKLWVKTITHLFKTRLGENLPEELVESLQYVNDYVMAEQYNKLLDR